MYYEKTYTDRPLLNFIFLLITAIILVNSITYSAAGFDKQDGAPSPIVLKILELELDSDFNEDSEDDIFNASSEDNESVSLINSQSWAPTSKKILHALIAKRAPLDAVEYSDDFALLVEASKPGTAPLVIRSHLATILLLCATPETIEASRQLNLEIALDPTFPSEKRIDAFEELERINLPGNAKLVYETRTNLARDKSFLGKDRCELASNFLYSRSAKDLKHAITLFKEILSDNNYNSEIYDEILSKIHFIYYSNSPDLYIYSRIKIITIMASSQTTEIMQRFILMGELLMLRQIGHGSKTNYDSDIDIEIFRSIKHSISEADFKKKLQLRFAPLHKEVPQESFALIECFYKTPDNKLPPLNGNLVSLLNLIGFDYYQEYETAKQRIEQKHQQEFLDEIQTYKPTKHAWDSMIEQAKSDPIFMEKLKQYLKTYFPNNRVAIDFS